MSTPAGVNTLDELEMAAFRREVREFVHESLAPETRRKTRAGLLLEKADHVRWQQALYRRGWFPPSWPKEHGGAGWTAAQQRIFLEESVMQGAPGLIPFGINMVGPVLYTFGTPEQKDRYLPGILTSDTWWCQGYSEPNAGSDLASLTTRAVLEGDRYIVNGTKMWTTDAQWSDMMHCLVRTEKSARKQQGISFLLIDMRTPGISIKPIVMLDGVPHTNQVFFDNVAVPVANRVGAEGDGWELAKFLLSHERAFIDRHQSRLIALRQMRLAAKRLVEDVPRAPGTESLLQRLARVEIRMMALAALERLYIAEWAQGTDDGLGSSVLKIRGTELLQVMTQLWRDLQGRYGACYDVTHVESGEGLASAHPWIAAAPVNYLYLFSRCHSIFGGSNEIQRTIIARRLLGV
jgi:alkylation response protein AidB-like acyl-CoA dehydrogenase